MNKTELIEFAKLKKEGWKVIHGGCPDFLCLKIENGVIKDIKVVEVKYNGDKLSYEQEIFKKAFKYLNVKYELKHYTYEPIQTSPVQSKPDHSTPNHLLFSKERR